MHHIKWSCMNVWLPGRTRRCFCSGSSRKQLSSCCGVEVGEEAHHWNQSVTEAQVLGKLRWLLAAQRGFPPFLTWCCGAPGVRCPAASSPAAHCCGGARPWVYPRSRYAGALRCRPVWTKHHQNTRSTAVSSLAEWLSILSRSVVNSNEWHDWHLRYTPLIGQKKKTKTSKTENITVSHELQQ